MKKKTMWIGGAAIGVVLLLAGAGIAVAVDGFDDDNDADRTSQVSDQNTGAGQDQSAGNNNYDNDNDYPDSDDAPISDADRASAEKAAIAAADGGTVTDLDRSDDADHAWEVELTFADGHEVDVELDADFGVVRVDPHD